MATNFQRLRRFEAVVKVMVDSESGCNSVVSFCEHGIVVKETAERSAELNAENLSSEAGA